MCDNEHCPSAFPETRHMMCSRCKKRKYCSVACQKQDWKEGGHKANCVPEGQVIFFFVLFFEEKVWKRGFTDRQRRGRRQRQTETETETKIERDQRSDLDSLLKS